MASRFWVGGTGTWDASTTTHWSATSGGAGGASVPGSADTVTFDASSGGGTVTPSADISVVSITCGAFTGTLDWSANNNNVTLSQSFSGTGTGTRTINMGNGTWTITNGLSTAWAMATTTNLTFNANNSTLVFTGNVAALTTFATGGLTYHNVTLGASAGGYTITGSNPTINGTLSVSGPTNIFALSSSTMTVGTLAFSGGSASGLISIITSSPTVAATISSANTPAAMDWMAFRGMTFTGGGTFSATNAFNLGGNTGVSVSPPAGGGVSGSRMIGG